MKLNSFRDLFIYMLSEAYLVENQLVIELPKMAKKCDSEELREALLDHVNETKEQVKRLEEVYKILNEKPVKIEGAGVRPLLNDAEKIVKESTPSPLLDAAIISCAQKVEHFEIACYGTLCEFADCVGHDEIKAILGDSLKEEHKADTILTKLAKGRWFRAGINEEATHNLHTGK